MKIQFNIFLFALCLTQFSNLAAQKIDYQDTVIASKHYLKGLEYEGQHDYENALIEYQKALRIFRSIYGNRHHDVVSVLTSMAFTYSNIGDLVISHRYLQEASDINLKLTSEYDKSMQFYYSTLSLIDLALFNYEESLNNSLKAVKTIEFNGQEDYTKLSEAYQNIGTAYSSLGNYFAASEYFKKAIDNRKKYFEDDHMSIGKLYGELGKCFLRLGDYEGSLFFNSLMIDSYEFVSPKPNLEIAEAYVDIAGTYREINEFKKALDYLNKAIKIFKSCIDENHIDFAYSYFEMGTIYYLMGKYDLAEKYLDKSISIHNVNMQEPITADITSPYINLGLLHQENMEYQLADEYFTKSLNLLIKHYGNDSPKLVSVYINLANNYIYLSEYNKALEYSYRAQEILLKHPGPEFALSYSSIGNILISLEEYEMAIDFFNAALKIKKNLKQRNKAGIHNNLGIIYRLTNDDRKAKNNFKQALEIYSRELSNNHPRTINCLNNLAYQYLKEENTKRALSYYNEAIQANLELASQYSVINSASFLMCYSPWLLLQSLLGKATCQELLQQEHLAYESLIKCDSVFLVSRQNMSKQDDKISFSEFSFDIYKRAIRLSYKFFKESTTKEEREYYFNQILKYSERMKSGVLRESINVKKTMKVAGIPDTLISIEQNLQKSISAINNNISLVKDSTSLLKYYSKLFEKNRKLDELISLFETKYPKYYNLKYNNNEVGLKEIQNLLDNKTTIRSYILHDSLMYIINISKRHFNVQNYSLPSDILESIKLLKLNIFGNTPFYKTNYQKLAYHLFELLMPDYDSILNYTQDLIIVPDGALTCIPFEALLSANNRNKNKDFSSLSYLINDFNISYQYSINLIYKQLLNEKANLSPDTTLMHWVAFAPIFDRILSKEVNSAQNRFRTILKNLHNDTLMLSGRFLDEPGVPALPETETEIITIYNMHKSKGLSANIYTRNDANEYIIKTKELNNYRRIHLATHGFVNSEVPELSGLLFYPQFQMDEDGIVYTNEIFSLNLNASLLVLSACETGLGMLQKGEGLIGLSRAFLYAGAENLVVSLWQVSDNSTSELMIEFYDSLLETNEQSNYAESLRDAKLILINSEKYSHPKYWSPFILVGR